MGYIYIAMGLIAILATVGGVVGYLAMMQPVPLVCTQWLERFMTTLLVLSICCSLLLVNYSTY